jgi:hypothetical protein
MPKHHLPSKSIERAQPLALALGLFSAVVRALCIATARDQTKISTIYVSQEFRPPGNKGGKSAKKARSGHPPGDQVIAFTLDNSAEKKRP